MSGPGFQELVVLFVIGLIILGPERLPRVASQIGRWVGKARRTANQLRYQLEREITIADIEDRKKKKEQQEPKNTDKTPGAKLSSTDDDSSQPDESNQQAHSETGASTGESANSNDETKSA